ncbi:MAG: DUF2779 domain-containing protein [Woeseia sp.]
MPDRPLNGQHGMATGRYQADLSKSRLISAWQCLKKLHLEIQRPDLASQQPGTEALFRAGREVGEIARQLYGTPGSVVIPYQKGEAMVQQTTLLLEQGANEPIFEATFRHRGVLVRVDVLFPGPGGWHAVEVKASTSVKDVHVIDCAIQWWVMQGAGIPVQSIALGHLNNQFVYEGDGNYAGLLVEQDLTEEARGLGDAVSDLARRAKHAASGRLPDVRVGMHCHQPYDCDFRAFCWPLATPYPVPALGGSKAKHAEWVNRGYTDLRDIPAGEITADRQQRIQRITRTGEAELLPGAKETLEALGYPRYYLDFETIAPAIPLWAGTRPYESLPVQWSVHTDDGTGDGSLNSAQHAEFLDLSGEPPLRALAGRMIDTLGTTGPVFMYTDYERRVILDLVNRFPDLGERLQRIVARLIDLAEIVRTHYYHPRMLGSWSIKAVGPAIAPHLDYAQLPGINDGMAASEGFLEAIQADTPPPRKATLKRQLLRYCRFDTEVMVEIVRFLCQGPDGRNRDRPAGDGTN